MYDRRALCINVRVFQPYGVIISKSTDHSNGKLHERITMPPSFNRFQNIPEQCNKKGSHPGDRSGSKEKDCQRLIWAGRFPDKCYYLDPIEYYGFGNEEKWRTVMNYSQSIALSIYFQSFPICQKGEDRSSLVIYHVTLHVYQQLLHVSAHQDHLLNWNVWSTWSNIALYTMQRSSNRSKTWDLLCSMIYFTVHL